MFEVKVPNEYDARRADPTLQVFVDALREALDKEPLYDRRYRTDAERFYQPPAQLPASPTRAPG